MITAAGGLPGETMKNWRVKSPHTFDLEFGFSCMGYEIAGGWGAAMADPTRETIVMVGDGSYLMMNSDIYSTVLTGHKLIVVRLRQWRLRGDQPAAELQGRRLLQQPDQGLQGEGALQRRLRQACRSRWVRWHARCESLAELEQALDWAKTTDRTTVISIVTDAYHLDAGRCAGGTWACRR